MGPQLIVKRIDIINNVLSIHTVMDLIIGAAMKFSLHVKSDMIETFYIQIDTN